MQHISIVVLREKKIQNKSVMLELLHIEVPGKMVAAEIVLAALDFLLGRGPMEIPKVIDPISHQKGGYTP